MEFKRQKYMDALVERMHNGMIKVVTGIRRSGKSYLLFNLFARYLMQQGTAMDHILTMQLDRWDMRRYRDPDMLLSWIHERMTDEGDYYILLDEVQFLDHFEEVPLHQSSSKPHPPEFLFDCNGNGCAMTALFFIAKNDLTHADNFSV